MRDTALLVDELGYDSLWTWDHFVALQGDPGGPNFEGWQVLAAWAAVTKRVKIGMLVSGNTYRHPAVLANMAATLDHISGGRAILGLGAAWHEDEHRMYGIEFGTPGERLAKLAEAAAIVRSLLDEQKTTFEGRHYQLRDATCSPKPLQERLPLMIGGGGERKTLRVTARHADIWHGFGSPQELARKVEVLRRHCADAGRDPAEILPTSGIQPRIVLRDDPKDVDAWLRKVAEANRMERPLPGPSLRTADEAAARMAEYWRAGIRGIIVGQVAPFDRETIERIAREVRPRAERLLDQAA